MIYILEAHAANVWQMESNVQQGVVFALPKSMGERESVADSCVRNLHIQIPALLDDFSDSTEKAYTGWPDRLYVIDREGRVAAKTAAGPFGFHPEEIERVLKSGTLRASFTSPPSQDPADVSPIFLTRN